LRLSLLQFKPQTVASWSLLLVPIVMLVCFSQNFGLSSSCPSATHANITEQLTTPTPTQANLTSECSSSEHLINVFAVNLEFVLPMFILALVIAAIIFKQSGKTHLFSEPISYYGVRRHLAFCTFQE